MSVIGESSAPGPTSDSSSVSIEIANKLPLVSQCRANPSTQVIADRPGRDSIRA